MADSASLEDEPQVPFKFFRVVCGHPGYTPGDGQTSRVYSKNPVLHLYTSCYVTVNKPVLSYLLLHFLPQWWPRPECTLCTYCSLHLCSLPLTHWPQLHALVTLSSAFISDTFVQLLLCTLHWLQLNKRFLLLISLRNQQTFFHIHSFCWKLAVATTAHNFWTRYSMLVFPHFCFAHHFYFLHVPFQPTILSFVITLPYVHSSVCLFFCPTVATNSYSSWDECP